MKWLTLGFCLLLALGWTSAANILMFHILSSYSHRVSMYPLADALASKGHNVTYMTPYGPKDSKTNPKVTEIYIKQVRDFMDATINADFNINVRVQKSMPVLYEVVDQMELGGCQSLLTSPEFKSWMDKKPKIDLVIEDLMPDCLSAVAHTLGAKSIVYNTLPFFGKFSATLGLPMESGPTDITRPFPQSMTFWERVENTINPLFYEYYQHKMVATYEAMFKSALGVDDFPSLYDLYRNISLVLMTGNYISDQPRSLPPMFVSVPAMHVRENGPGIPKDMDAFINSKNADGTPNEGFVYISLGTVVVTADLPEHIRLAFWNTIKAFPKIKFLWRWSGEFPKDKPDNLYVEKWFPQQDLLSHPKVRGFVTQAGRPSMQEALSKGVPMISFPVLGDQDFNALRMEEVGAGIKLELTKVTDTELTQAVATIVQNGDFRKTAKEASILFKDLPMTPKDTAVWWVEYVLRHDDLTHLKPMGRNQTWYERRMLDVWFLIFSVASGAILLTLSLLGLVLKCVLGGRSSKAKSSGSAKQKSS